MITLFKKQLIVTFINSTVASIVFSWRFLRARRNASADTSRGLSACVCLYVTSQSSIEMAEQVELAFQTRELPFTPLPTRCDKEIRVSLKYFYIF